MKRLSIIMPVRNGERHIGDALTSLAHCMADTDELIIIDDGSTDQTCSIISSFKQHIPNLQVMHSSHIGPAAARNLGLNQHSGQFVSFLDHDDIWPEGKLNRQLVYLDRHPGVSVVVGKTAYEFEGAEANQIRVFKNELMPIHHVHLGASTFRSSVFSHVGVFNESLKFSEDHDFFFRTREAGLTLHFEPEIGLRYRVHGSNMSFNKSLKEVGFFGILADSIKRRRSQGIIDQLPVFGPTDDA